MHNTELVRDSGIRMFSDDQHIQIIYNKGKANTDWIERVLIYREPKSYSRIFKQVAYPTVEYSSVLWNRPKVEKR